MAKKVTLSPDILFFLFLKDINLSKPLRRLLCSKSFFFFKLSSRHISTSTLHSLLNFYSWPINLVIFKVSFKLSLRETSS